MDKLTTFVIAVLAVFFLTIAGTLFGAVAGLVVGLFFSTAIHETFAAFGVYDLTMWQLGATLGFCGSFFRSTLSYTSQDTFYKKRLDDIDVSLESLKEEYHENDL